MSNQSSLDRFGRELLWPTTFPRCEQSHRKRRVVRAQVIELSRTQEQTQQTEFKAREAEMQAVAAQHATER